MRRPLRLFHARQARQYGLWSYHKAGRVPDMVVASLSRSFEKSGYEHIRQRASGLGAPVEHGPDYAAPGALPLHFRNQVPSDLVVEERQGRERIAMMSSESSLPMTSRHLPDAKGICSCRILRRFCWTVKKVTGPGEDPGNAPKTNPQLNLCRNH